MPRLNQAVPKYRKHRASGQAVVTLSGQDHYLGPHGTKASTIEYDRLIAEWLANGRECSQPQAEITIAELCVRYLKFAKGYYVKDGRCTKVTPDIKCALKYLRTWYGKNSAVEFGPVRLRALRQRMVDDGHSRRYVNDHCDRIKRMYKWAAGEQLIPADAYRCLTMVEGLRRGRTEARETAPVMPVDDATVDATPRGRSSWSPPAAPMDRRAPRRPTGRPWLATTWWSCRTTTNRARSTPRPWCGCWGASRLPPRSA
ncbi:hypothetical protein Pla123a_43130 [Posidoniimonas polymericola]|uniref:Core-binding (CB) domain-containing protein n=1 Tax=Posidoniimonas polymericola TaxID=2528002 RepID=A0A5C5XY04_9BACT|nr:hypothetical protein [Posidoniimonas polymericola]TWT67754.1 hypothetical protein Pla123a_43130 [Posidoniimonas polymericola]